MAKIYPKLGCILKKLLFDHDIKPADLSREINLPPPTIHRLITGKSGRPHQSSLEPIASYFSITIDQLLGEEPLPNAVGNNSASLPTASMIQTIPILMWDSVISQKINNTEHGKFIATTGNISNESFALIMNDHSMEPLFPRRSILLFDPKRKQTDRSYVLIKLNDKNILIFRQLLIDVDQQYLKPLNPDLSTYKMRLLDEKDLIIGCLFESRINHEPEEIEQTLELEI